jgi:hypothetical protein
MVRVIFLYFSAFFPFYPGEIEPVPDEIEADLETGRSRSPRASFSNSRREINGFSRKRNTRRLKTFFHSISVLLAFVPVAQAPRLLNQA